MEPLDNQLVWTNFLLLIEATLFSFIIALICFNKSKERGEKEGSGRDKNLAIWGYFFLILAFANILILLWRFAFTENIVVDIMERASNALFYFAVFIRVLDIEKRVFEKKRYYFSIILVAVVLINILVPPDFLKTISVWQVVFLVIVTVGYSVFPIIYFQLYRKSSGDIRSNALKVTVGACVLALGYLFRPENLVAYRTTPLLNIVVDIFYITAPIAIIIGAFLMYDSFRKEE